MKALLAIAFLLPLPCFAQFNFSDLAFLAQGTAPFSPIDRGADLAAWYKADAGVFEDDAGTDPAEDGDGVANWKDQSVNNRPLLQTVSGARPLYKTGIQNGLPAIQFVSTDVLGTASAAPVTAPPFTIYIVAASDNAVNPQFVITIWTTSSTTHSWFIDWAGNTGGDPLAFAAQETSGGFAVTTTGYTANVAAICTAQEISTTSRKCWINGGSLGTNTTSKNPPSGGSINRFSVGLFGPTSANPFTGYVFEVVVTNVEDSAAQRSAMETYLDTKWNVP